MRTIERSSAFKRDYRQLLAGSKHRPDLEVLVSSVVEQLLTDQPLPQTAQDHALIGDWAGYRECHVKPDVLLIYRKPDEQTLRLARIGSHSELFG